MNKSMKVNFDLLYERILDANNTSNFKKIKAQLKEISNKVICIGSGGSSVVSEFASKVLAEKNNCITITKDPRDLLYDKNSHNFDELFICSYSGKGHGINVALKSDLTKNLFTNNNLNIPNVNIITYATSIPKEKSFISLGGTLIPISILLNYYLNGKSFKKLIKSVIKDNNMFKLNNNTNFEIMSGFDTSVAAQYLESTITEAGLGMVVVHNKYDYCHGRSTLSYHHQNHTLIYLKNNNSELDKLLLQEVSDLYNNIILIESNYNDLIINNFNLLIKSMYLTKAIAEMQKKDLSQVKYAPAVKKLYYFKGEM